MAIRLFGRMWSYDSPNATNGHWHFLFHITFEQASTQRVVVTWRELCLGSGSFVLGERYLSWGTLFRADKRLRRMAEDHAFEWNKIDARCG